MDHELRVHQIELEMQNEELREAQVKLAAARARYFDLYDLAPVGYVTLSEAGLIREANLTAATLLGVARSDLVKLPISRYIFKQDQDIYYLHRRRLVATGSVQACELRMLRGDGSPFWAQMTASFTPGENGAAVHRVTLIDVSVRKRMEGEMQALNAHLEKASLAKSEFLSRMSHELRSPLNAVLGFAQLMASAKPPPSPSQKASLDQILGGGWYLLKLIEEILDLATIESGKVSLTLKPVSLAEVLHECHALLEGNAQSAGLRVSLPAFDRPCMVLADRTRLTQIVINLLSNAVKYNRSGGTVEVTYRTVRANRVRIEVQDTGEGLSAGDLAQLFQPFNRLGKENGPTEGTGIGLAVSKRLVEAQGGEIGVRSTVGAGTVFWFELNLAPDGSLNRARAEPGG